MGARVLQGLDFVEFFAGKAAVTAALRATAQPRVC